MTARRRYQRDHPMNLHMRYNRQKLPRFFLFNLSLFLAASPATNGVKSGVILASSSPATESSPSTATTLGQTIKPAHLISLPDGFVRVVISDRTAMCEPADQGWVRDCLAHTPPGTQPSTRPSDLRTNLKQQKVALESEISAELDLKDVQKTSHFVDETLVPLIDHLDRLRVRIIYLVITKDDLKHLVISGWGSDQFYYNRVADKIAFNGMVNISLDGADGESILPAPFLPTDSVEARTASLREDIGRTEAGTADMISREAQSAVQLSFAKFIAETAIAPLNLKLEQDWFSAGVVGVLSSEYMARISGAQAEQLIRNIAQPDRNNPVSPASIDLAHPIPPDQLRPQIAGAYADAFRRKSVGVVDGWVHRAGPDAISKTFAALHAGPPSDGPALVQLIRKTTGIDLTADLNPQ